MSRDPWPEGLEGPERDRSAQDRIQRLIDGLGAELRLPVSVDDESFRLQFYSPQQGTLDRVRIESILFRDSPEAAKAWVRSHGVPQAQGPILIPAAEELGLLPRVCLPIPHQDVLLGYLWIIDAHGTLDAAGLALAERCAREVAPLLYRRRFFARLDRQAERDAVADLIDPRAEIRERGVVALAAARGSREVTARVLVVRVVPVATAADDTEQVATELALELALEQARALFPPGQLRFVRRETGAAVVLTDAAAVAVTGAAGSGVRLHRAVHARLGSHRVVVGVGGMVTDLTLLVRSHEEARDAAEVAVRDPQRPEVLGAQWLGPERVLLRVPPAELRAQADAILGPLCGHRDAELLLDTLRAFLAHGGDVAATATTLVLHRSSVYARLRRIEDVLAADLADGAVRFALQHALVARSLADA